MELEGGDDDAGDNHSEVAFGEVDEALNDFGNAQIVGEVAKNDAVIFVVDCSEDIFKQHPQETVHVCMKQAQIDKVLSGYSSFLMSKVISNPNDRVGLILYNVKHSNNSLKFSNINVVHPLDVVTAATIKDSNGIKGQFEQKFGFTDKKVPLYEVLWLFNNEISTLPKKKFNIRLFLFTSEDNPHPHGSTERDQAINHAKKLASEDVQIELFPLQKSPTSRFDLRKFYVEVLTLDPEEINEAVLDTSDKVMNLHQRLRQKEYKKRTLNREFLTLGDEMKIGIKIYGLYRRVTKPLAKKLDPRTNKPVKRVAKLMSTNGDVLHESEVGTFFPIGGEKVILSKADVEKIRNFDEPGMTLVGFKPRSKLKMYHNYRTSYFIYPDEERVNGSGAVVDALIKVMAKKELIAIVKFISRKGSQLRICALLPQKESYDEDHFQTPPGFNLIFLPYSEDIASFSGDKTTAQPVEISKELAHMCKLLINNLTINDFDVRNFDNPNLQKFYAHLQAHALGEKEVDEPADLLKQDEDAMLKCIDIIQMIKDTLQLELQGDIEKGNCQEKQEHLSEDEYQRPVKRGKASKKESKVKKQPRDEPIKVEDGIDVKNVERLVREGEFGRLKVADIKQYLKSKGLSTSGNKQELIDRIIVFLAD